MIIDTHTHLLDYGHWPTEWWGWVARDWASKDPERKPTDIQERIELGLVDPDGSRMVAVMDAAGVDMSVVLPIDWGPDFSGTKPVSEVVDHALNVSARFPGRFVPFGGIDPRRDEATELVSGWLSSGAQGMKLYPSCGWHPASDEAGEVYAQCNETRAPVLFHTGDPLPLLNREYSNPSLLREVASSFPDMPIWLGHAGAHRWWTEALDLAAEFANVKLEMSVWVWDDSTPSELDTFYSHMGEAVQVLGADKVLFGTDNVSGTRVRGPGFLGSILTAYRHLPDRLRERGIDLTTEQLAGILGSNALRDLKMNGGASDASQ